MLTDAVLVPAEVGVNVTVIVHLDPDAMGDEGQLFVSPKSPLLVPVIAILEMLSTPVPVFDRVMDWGTLVVATCWFPKVRDGGLRVTAPCVAVSLRLTVCGLPAALSVTVKVAL